MILILQVSDGDPPDIGAWQAETHAAEEEGGNAMQTDEVVLVPSSASEPAAATVSST